MSQKSYNQILPLLKVNSRVAITFEDQTHEGHIQEIGDGYLSALVDMDGEETYAEFYEDDTGYSIEIIG